MTLCPECSQPLPLRNNKSGKRQVFCSLACKQTHANRCASRGKALVKIALGWRQLRGGKGLGSYLFGEMTAMLDAWNAEDREAGRMAAKDYAASVCDWSDKEGIPPVRYIDPEGCMNYRMNIETGEGVQPFPHDLGTKFTGAKKAALDQVRKGATSVALYYGPELVAIYDFRDLEDDT